MKYKDYIAFDFDSVISSYKRPFKYDSLGEPQQEIIDTIQYYYDKGYYILIFTGRSDTPVIKEWLKKYNVPYHGFNVDPAHWEFTSTFKPYFGVLVDDKAVNFHFSRNKKTSKELITEIDNILEDRPSVVSGDESAVMPEKKYNGIGSDTLFSGYRKGFNELHNIASLLNCRNCWSIGRRSSYSKCL